MKKIVNSLLLSAMGLGIVAGGVMNVGAQSVVDNRTTEADVTFTERKDENGNTIAGLRLLNVNNITFGTHEITAGAQRLESGSVTLKMEDQRGALASGNGWTIKASLNQFTNEEGEASLPGAELVLPTPNPTGEFTLPNVFGQTLKQNEQAKVASAQRAEGLEGIGEWDIKWDKFTLDIPAGSSSIDKHTATITWELTDAPE